MSNQGMHLTCQAQTAQALAQELEAQFEAMEDLAMVVAWGESKKKRQGFIELEWNVDEIDPDFIEELERDPRIDDFSVFTIPTMSDEQLRLLETL